MTFDEAKTILTDYWGIFKDLRPREIVQPNKVLKYTTARIKFAHFVFGEHLVKTDQLDKIMFEVLMESYGLIKSLFSERAEEINQSYRAHLEGLKSGFITEFRIPNPFGECVEVNEYFNFIGECLFYLSEDKNPHDLLGEDVSAAFVFEGLREKAVNENDIKLFKKLVNSRLTRFLHFNGEKNDEESFFV